MASSVEQFNDWAAKFLNEASDYQMKKVDGVWYRRKRRPYTSKNGTTWTEWRVLHSRQTETSGHRQLSWKLQKETN